MLTTCLSHAVYVILNSRNGAKLPFVISFIGNIIFSLDKMTLISFKSPHGSHITRSHSSVRVL